MICRTRPKTGKGTRHIDLHVHPATIHTIPELLGRPDLARLVSVLNRGPFMTHGSAFGLAPPREPGGALPLSKAPRAARCWCTSYVTFSFWYLAQNTPQNYQRIYEQLKIDTNGSEVFFVIQPAYFMTLFEWNCGAKYDETNATVCVLWVSGWGDSPAIAQSRWRNVTKTLVEFFEDFSRSRNLGPLRESPFLSTWRFDCRDQSPRTTAVSYRPTERWPSLQSYIHLEIR